MKDYVLANPMSISGYTGTGYMVINETTGDSAFMIGGRGNGGWADIQERLKQPIYALYFMFTNLDETAAILWKTTIGKIAGYLGDLLGILDIFDKCGTTQGVAAIAIWWVMSSATLILLMLAIVWAGVPGFLLGVAITYSLGTFLSKILAQMARRCE